MTKRFLFLRSTKNYDLFVEDGNEMNRLYLPKIGAKAINVEIVIADNMEATKS